MKLAIIGSRTIQVDNLENYIPEGVTEIVSGGAKGVDTSAREYALQHNIKLTEFLPQYNLYRRNAALMRNTQIVEYADMVLAFWDGQSKGTADSIKKAEKMGKSVKIIKIA